MISLPKLPILVFLLVYEGNSPAQAQVSVVDDIGCTVTLSSPAHRIVSLAPSITESLFAIEAGDHVVGVTDYCNFPPAARAKAKVGGMTNPSIETIVSLHPDLILLSMEGNVRDDFAALQRFGIPVFVSNPRTLEGIHRSLYQLGMLTGRTVAADSLIKRMRAREDSVHAPAAAQRQRTLFIVSLQPLMVVGRNTFLNELLERSGAENLAARLPSTYPTYSRESFLAENPDVIIVMSDILADVSTLTRLFPEWESLAAVRQHRVHRINADLVSRPGPRAVDGLETLFHILHERNQ
jgi:iron complex transport system substrate-binding protein